MKIRFLTEPKGRDYKKGQVVEFKSSVELTYARKFIARGWAEEIDEAAELASAQRAAAERRLAERASIEIPENYADLPLIELRALAGKFSDGPIKSKDDATAVIAAELNRRVPAG